MKIYNTIQLILLKYKAIILYLFFGACSTCINFFAYYLCYNVGKCSNLLSTAVAWLAAVLFAYVTNKLWVFESKSFDGKTLLREVVSFFSCRIATGVLDMIIMYIAVDRLAKNELLWKLLSNLIVIVLNYAASKLVIFKSGQSDGKSNST